jgi:outer membrane protein TolC
MLIAWISGCASVDSKVVMQRVSDKTESFAQTGYQLPNDDQQRSLNEARVEELIQNEVDQNAAVNIALLNSPDLHALVADSMADMAIAAQGGRISNPQFAFERMTAPGELELAVTLPKRQQVAKAQVGLVEQRMIGAITRHITQVRQAWVRAVTAQELRQYAQKVFTSAEASAELARRMEVAGNFNRLDRAREQAFYADAATSLALASHEVVASREALNRLLGLTESQSQAMRLTSRLPDIPQMPRDTQVVGQEFFLSRIDVQLAKIRLDVASQAQGLNLVTSWSDVELTAIYKTKFADGARTNPDGFEVGIVLPIFDWGDLKRDAMNARTLAAANAMEATVRNAGSELRQTYSAYLTAHDIAKHYQTEVVPLRKLISEENLLRYNGMIIGVFELLADARDQVATIMSAIRSKEQFWLADAALLSSIAGSPVDISLSTVGSAAGSAAKGH